MKIGEVKINDVVEHNTVPGLWRVHFYSMASNSAFCTPVDGQAHAYCATGAYVGIESLHHTADTAFSRLMRCARETR